MFSQSGVPERWGDHVARVSGETLRRTQEAGATCCDSGGELKTGFVQKTKMFGCNDPNVQA